MAQALQHYQWHMLDSGKSLIILRLMKILKAANRVVVQLRGENHQSNEGRKGNR